MLSIGVEVDDCLRALCQRVVRPCLQGRPLSSVDWMSQDCHGHSRQGQGIGGSVVDQYDPVALLQQRGDRPLDDLRVLLVTWNDYAKHGSFWKCEISNHLRLAGGIHCPAAERSTPLLLAILRGEDPHSNAPCVDEAPGAIDGAVELRGRGCIVPEWSQETRAWV